MMKRAISFWSVVITCAVCAGVAPAHEFFVMPNDAKKAYTAGDTVTINALSTHYFTVGEELEPVEVNEVYVVKNGVASAPLVLTQNAERMWYETTYRLTDTTPVIVVGNRKGGFYCLFTNGDYADGTRAEVAAASPGKTIAKARYFAKYSKLYLNPAAKDTTFSVPLGHDLEIIPLVNPATARRNGTMRFKVLYKGAPLVNAPVNATWDYYDYKTENAFADTKTTDAKGEVSFKLTASGLWLIRASDTRKSATPGCDEDNINAIVVFAVK